MMRYRYVGHAMPVAMGIALLLAVAGITAASADGIKVYEPESGRLLPLESHRAGHEDRHYDRERHAWHGWGERGWREGRDRVNVYPSIIVQPDASSLPNVETRAVMSGGSRVCHGEHGATTWSTRPIPCASASERQDATPQ
ncbi:hypothetical protein C8E00_105152 [Chromohalobacter marismortui]|uniref:Uncharacterized protein n=1 Tax=Chromohalobacter marismortui TaxID=42055 RepID=A0A4R7NM35_9GAMM|nr:MULTISPECIES: hypothetical protein [Chromohalobacter]MCI0510250.1 hypothetical protein [Chromohalobacter sp.]MCI0593426.1 hypothetical protein [Chromohalobacter sp.]TDU21668.1 hypothetical protein C8E00_105152 [Chromohalobacter marismortui]